MSAYRLASDNAPRAQLDLLRAASGHWRLLSWNLTERWRDCTAGIPGRMPANPQFNSLCSSLLGSYDLGHLWCSAIEGRQPCILGHLGGP